MAKAVAAAAMKGEWKAPLTAKGIARLHFKLLLTAATASVLPESTTWASLLSLAITTPSVAATRSSSSRRSKPITAVMAPPPAAAIKVLRLFISCRPVAKSNTPATCKATSSPRLWPATSWGTRPWACRASASRLSITNRAGWVLRVSLRSLRSPPPALPEQIASRSRPSRAEACSKRSRAPGSSSTGSAMPTFCEPWPGNTQAMPMPSPSN